MSGCGTRRAFTLIELLVVIFIIGLLVAILLPAIQAAREAARRVQCKNHLRQLSLGAILHEQQQGHFPTGGWQAAWVGDKDRGFGEGQPGGWGFNILPFIEQTSLYELAGDGRADEVTPQQLDAGMRLFQEPIEIMYCPSRRAAALYPLDPLGRAKFLNAHRPDATARLDYAANAGSTNLSHFSTDVFTYQEASLPKWCHNKTGTRISRLPRPGAGCDIVDVNGVIFQRSEVGIRHISDGSSKTYLLGEKYLRPEDYEVTKDIYSDFTWCSGFTYDNARFGELPPIGDAHPRITVFYFQFGSAHPHGLHMSYCDGSVRTVEYDIDPVIHAAAANRLDGVDYGP